MKYILLAAGEGIRFIEKQKNLPKCLVKIGDQTILDNIVKLSKKFKIDDIHLIGGFEILKIMQSYPSLKYYYNEKWEDTNTLYSLSKAIYTMDDDLIISYTDIMYSEKIIEQLVSSKKDMAIVYDSEWATRYEGREDTEASFEKVYQQNNKYILSKNKIEKGAKLLGEYSGLLFIKQEKLNKVKKSISRILVKNKNATILHLMNDLISVEMNTCDFFDIKGGWAEVDSKQDIEKFTFGTKAETLSTLKNHLTKSYILEQVTFSVRDYKEDNQSIISSIKKYIRSKYLIVRSSALNEDTHISSMAGNYTTVLRVPAGDYEALDNAILNVMQSYEKNNQKQNEDNQVLVQSYLDDVTMSGVLFTKNLQTFAPYYIVNYDEGNDTESVTSGKGESLSTFICYKYFKEEIKDKKLKVLIDAVREIESVTCYDALDIEFAFVGDRLYILQVRPIAAKKNMLQIPDYDFQKEIIKIKEYVNDRHKKHPNLLGKGNGYGVMPDWNPAEIIGINPKKLAFDLYRYIITDTVWQESRSRLGYRKVEYSPGLVSFSGKPYVDIRMSFNTFIPSKIEDKIAEKLIDYFMDQLKRNPEQHDKVEFNIVMTSFDFDFDIKTTTLKKFGFTEQEINTVIKHYIEFTQNIINQTEVSIESELKKLNTLRERRDKVIKSNLSIPEKIINLLEDCKRYGTLPFAILARFGFVGSAFLKSLLNQNSITKEQHDDFLRSIHTVAKNFISDYNLLQNGSMDKQAFINKYGHLRPGSYDITSLNYQKNFDNYIDTAESMDVVDTVEQNAIQDIEVIENVQKKINEHALDFSAEVLLKFVKDAMEAREFAKFEFTKNLNLILGLIEEFSSEHNVTIEESAHLNLNDILKYAYCSSDTNIESELKNSIYSNKQKHLLASAIQLPELIFENSDIEMFFYPKSKPNYITQHSVIGTSVVLQGNKIEDIDHKIVFIEHADPGFDWIFSHHIKGLVTKYGGAASHMAIRCAEFDLPAAIGCGDKIFDHLVMYKRIHLDCTNKFIEGIS